jgi:hypothetical protein
MAAGDARRARIAMPTVFQQLFSPVERAFAPREPQYACAAQDDDIVLGCESANPSLQFEAWEPLTDPRGGASAAPAY